jgi:hypothetical protein
MAGSTGLEPVPEVAEAMRRSRIADHPVERLYMREAAIGSATAHGRRCVEVAAARFAASGSSEAEGQRRFSISIRSVLDTCR